MDSCGSPGQADVPGTGVLRVSEVSSIICDLLDSPALEDIWVLGEVTNYKNHTSGHRYFSLSEQAFGRASVVNCVMWRASASRLGFEPANGMDLLVRGTIEVYEPQGKYQLIVKEMHPAGRGEKHLLVEQWKQELAGEGLFLPERKRPLPEFPCRIGVVTSASGAVLHDIVNVISRRYPLEIVLSPAAVQGDGAHREIADAIRRIDGRVDVIIVGRGGGSFEDLFPFNHPDVVRAIASSTTPVISAVGHDVDITLSDFAADLCAPTPSAAAERAVPDRRDLLAGTNAIRESMQRLCMHAIESARREFEDLSGRMQPRRLVRRLNERRQHLSGIEEQLQRAAESRMRSERLRLGEITAQLAGKNPLAPLERGYCLALRGLTVVGSVRELEIDETVVLRMRDGRCRVRVQEIIHDKKI